MAGMCTCPRACAYVHTFSYSRHCSTDLQEGVIDHLYPFLGDTIFENRTRLSFIVPVHSVVYIMLSIAARGPPPS